MGIRLDNVQYLHLLWLVLGLAVLAAAALVRQRRAAARFAEEPLLAALQGRPDLWNYWLRTGLVLAALTLLILAAVGPRWGRYFEDVPRRGIDVIFVLDVSRSMLAADVAPNRLGRAKQYIADMLEAMGGDRVGLVTFAGEPTLKVPLTINYAAFKMALDDVDVRSAPRGGTLIGDAVRVAAGAFTDEIKDYKAIVVLTDGDDQQSYPIEAAQQAFAERGIRVYAVGLGDASEGARVPDKSGQPGLFMKYEGQEVWSKMNAAPLREMARVGGGVYIPAGTANVDLGELLYRDRIARLEQREFEASRVERYHLQFQWFAGAALLLLIIEALLPERRRPAVNAG